MGKTNQSKGDFVKTQSSLIPSPIGEWVPTGDAMHSYGASTVELSVPIDRDNTLFLVCDADQVGRVPQVLARLLSKESSAGAGIGWLHRELRSKIYDFSEKQGITGFEAMGVLFHLATEFSARALVDDGLLEDRSDRGDGEAAAEESVPVPEDTNDLRARIEELANENKWLDNGLDKMTTAYESMKKENVLLRSRIDAVEENLRARDRPWWLCRLPWQQP